MPSDRSSITIHADGEEQDMRSLRKGGNPLQRGSACLSCRKRKMKCDATKPVCRQCVKANRAEECDYDDGRQKSRTQILQEKIAKLEDRIRELESAEAEQFSDEQQACNDSTPAILYETDTYRAQTSAMAGTSLGDEFGHHGAGNGTAYHHSSLSPAASGSGSSCGSGSGSGSSSSHNGNSMSYSPLMLDASNPALSYQANSGQGFGPSSTQYPPQAHQHQQDAFYSTQDMTVPATNEVFGYNMNMDLGMGINLDMGYDPSSIAMGLNTSAHHMGGMGMDMNMHLGMNIGLGTGLSAHVPNANISMPAYSTHNFSPFAGPGVSSPAYPNTHAMNTASMIMQPPPPTVSFPGSGPLGSLNHQTLGLGTNSSPFAGARPPATGQGASGASVSSSASKGKRSMSRWDSVVLPAQERKILVDIFLPHSRQCGLYLSPERLYRRLELDAAHPSLFPASPQNNSQDELAAPPAHPALANAIYLLACHFSSVHIPGSTFNGNGSSAGLTGKQADLSAHESQFLTRALRGIAAALEAGEAAASDSASSRSSRSARSRSRSASAGGSMRGSASPLSTSASPPTSAFQSISRPGSSSNPSSSGSGTGSASGVTTGLGGGVKEDPPDAATPLVDAVQASALLSVYFFAKARLLEGYYHASAAARLAVSLGMHQVRSAVWKPPQSSSFQATSIGSSAFDSPAASSSSTFAFTSSSDPNAGSWSGSPTPSPAVLLPPARSALEHAERVSLFWHVFFIDRCWSVATGLPSSLPDDEHPQLKISTVWPWDVQPGKEITRETADYQSLASLFLPGSTGRQGSENRSTKALKAKAAAFFEKAARIASLQSDPTQWEQLTQIEVGLDTFIAGLPPYAVPSASTGVSPLPSSTQPSSMTIDPDLALVHTLSHAAVIQLNHPRAQKDARAHAVCVRAATACVHIIRCLTASEYALLDPVIGTCWMCVSDVLLRERTWGGNMNSIRGVARGVGEAECSGVETQLDTVVAALKQLSYAFPVALYQVQKVEQSRNAPY